MFFDFIDIHRIFFILGTLEGELIKKTFELILFLLITYMVISEYSRDRRRELKFLVAAFGALAFQKLVSTTVLLGVVFGKLSPSSYRYYFPVMDHILEIFALVLLAHAFLYPIITKKYRSAKKQLMVQFILPGALYIIFQIYLIIEIIYLGNGHAEFTNYLSGMLFTLTKIVLLLYAVYMLSTRTDIAYRYRYSVIIAFLVYFVTPFLRLINIVFYEAHSARLFVAEQPFPLLAVLLFTRVIYLKLVDKAFLKKRLKISEEKYRHEKELGKMKEKFVSVVSHELRTPLTSINLYCSLLKDGKLGKMNAKQKKSLSVIKDESKRLSHLINDILDLAKLEDKKIELRLEDFDLHSFCKNNPSCSLAEQKGIKIVNKVPKKTKIRVDPERFQQVLINLLSNSIKYTDKGGKIILELKTKKDCWEVIVEDTGVGIAKKELENIFDKFYQVEHHMTRKEGGSGLGLTIAYELVKLHKGDIKAKSELGKGSSFSVFIPKNQRKSLGDFPRL